MNNMEKYLPIGTVCLLKEAKKRVMIIGYIAKGNGAEDKMYDYIGCLYPEGVLSSDQSLLFNHEQINQIFALGYSDNEQKELNNKIKDLVIKMNNPANLSSINIQNNDMNSNQSINDQPPFSV